MPNYANSKLYKIWSPSTELVYYGSTTQNLTARIRGHRNKYATWERDKGQDFVSSYAILEFKDYKIELVKLCPCKNREELHKEEGALIRSNDCVNMLMPGRTREEWVKLNKDKLKAYHKTWNEFNKVEQDKKKAIYRVENKDAINKRRSELYKANPEPMKTYQAGYRAENQDKIKARKNTPNDCSCGGTFNQDNKARHLRSKKHVDFLASGKTFQAKGKNSYYNENKEAISKARQTTIMCECGQSYTTNHKARHFKSKKHLSYKA